MSLTRDLEGSTMTAPAPAPAEAGKTPAVITWLVVATFTVILNETIMINAIPRLAEDFDVSYNAAQWLSTAFLLTMASVIPITGWFLQRVTTRAAFATAMITFAVRHRARAGRPDVLGAAPGPDHPGQRHRRDDAAADDHADDRRARARPRPRDGQRDARDVGRAGARSRRVRRVAAVRLVAPDLRRRAADRRRRDRGGDAQAQERRRAPGRRDRLDQRADRGVRFRRAGLRAERVRDR